jgi:DNA invertase Pin-like site-specific DNA recombinase
LMPCRSLGRHEALVKTALDLPQSLRIRPNKRIRYVRVSTDDQNPDLQRGALTGSGCLTIYEETASGKSAKRMELEHYRKSLRSGDILVVWRLARLGRSLSDLVKIIGNLEREGITFESLSKEIDTGSASGKLQFHVSAALAEFQGNLIWERALTGLSAARVRVGERKPRLNDKSVRVIETLPTGPVVRVTALCKRVGAVTPSKL